MSVELGFMRQLLPLVARGWRPLTRDEIEPKPSCSNLKLADTKIDFQVEDFALALAQLGGVPMTGCAICI
jgi:hypothetical protein